MGDSEGARQTVEAIVVSDALDFCKTPPGDQPVGYMLIAKFDQTVRTSTTVRFTQNEAFTAFSRIDMVVGDEPGTSGGVASGVNVGRCIPKTYSNTVRVNSHGVVNHGSEMWMNCTGMDGVGNVVGRVVYVKCAALGWIGSDGEPETEAEATETPPSFAEQQATDIAGAQAEIEQQMDSVWGWLSSQYDATMEAAQNIIDDPSIVLHNADRLKNEAIDFGKETIQAAENIYNDPGLAWQNAHDIFNSTKDAVGTELSDLWGTLESGVAANQPLTTLAKTAPRVLNLALSAAGLTGVAKAAVTKGTSLATSGLEALQNKGKALREMLDDETGAIGSDISSVKRKRNNVMVTPKLPVGGTYGELKKKWKGKLEKEGKEIHHMPPSDSTLVNPDDGFAIVMDKADHRALMTTGSSDLSGAFRNEMWTMYDGQGLKEAMDVAIVDVQKIAGSKYDSAMVEMLDQAIKQGKYPLP